MLNIDKVLSQCWSLREKCELFFAEPRVKVSGQYNFDALKTLTAVKNTADDNFVFQAHGAPVHYADNIVQLLDHEILNFLSS